MHWAIPWIKIGVTIINSGKWFCNLAGQAGVAVIGCAGITQWHGSEGAGDAVSRKRPSALSASCITWRADMIGCIGLVSVEASCTYNASFNQNMNYHCSLLHFVWAYGTWGNWCSHQSHKQRTTALGRMRMWRNPRQEGQYTWCSLQSKGRKRYWQGLPDSCSIH